MGEHEVFEARPVILGHRGCGTGTVNGYVENTLESFLAAVELGLDWLEVDVRRTSDDHLVVAHHPADGEGVFYADMTGEQASDRGTMPLQELLDALPAEVGVDLDLKSSMEDATRGRTQTTAAHLAPVASRAARDRPVLVTTFDPAALDILREHAPQVPRGFLTWLSFPIEHAVAAAGHLDVQVLAAHWRSLRPKDTAPQQRPVDYVIDLVHESGREFLAWCPPLEFAQELLNVGADALCVNNVPTFVETALQSPIGT